MKRIFTALGSTIRYVPTENELVKGLAIVLEKDENDVRGNLSESTCSSPVFSSQHDSVSSGGHEIFRFSSHFCS